MMDFVRIKGLKQPQTNQTVTKLDVFFEMLSITSILLTLMIPCNF